MPAAPSSALEHRFNALVADNRDRLYRICRAYLPREPAAAQDLYQDILVQLWMHLPAFRGEAQRSTWVYRVALAGPDPETLPLAADSGDDARRHNALLDQLHRCIATLPNADRLLVSLVLENAAYQQIGDVLGLSLSNVGVRLNRLKKKLAACVAPVHLAD